MALERVSNILRDADKNSYGVIALNVFNYESIAWAIEAAELEETPVLIQFYPGLSFHIPLEAVAVVVKTMAKKVKTPIGLHLDHSNTFEDALAGISAGFPSIMIDGSKLSFEKNLVMTKRVVDRAHAMGVEVEAELGHVGSGALIGDYQNESNFTRPEAAKEFVDATDIDCLAISIGNAHGHYISSPHLKFDLLNAINQTIDIPLVLHGGSGIPNDQMQKAISLGINKLNIATEYDRNYYKATYDTMSDMSEKGTMLRLIHISKEATMAFLRAKIRLFRDI